MAPAKKRLLWAFIVVYVLATAGLMVHAFLGTHGRAQVYGLTREVTEFKDAHLMEPLEVRALADEGVVLDADRVQALDEAGVATVTVAGGEVVDTAQAVGRQAGVLTLPAGTKLTPALWRQVLVLEARARPALRIPIQAKGNIIGFSFTMAVVVLNFFGLLCLLYVFVWDPILGMLDARAETIRSEIDEAAAKRKEARGLRDKYAELMDGAKREREALVAAGQRDGEAERQKILDRARDEAEKLIAQAREEIGAETEKARRELMAEVGRLSTDVAGAILSREVRPEDHDALVQDFLAKVDAGGTAERESGDGPA